ncbi:hypothetical protein PIB30_045115 [Stylosanthes scabra]|uniref:Aminotransferase-like plant mobile domain-containing protein n=1 Tax=Stylosanthes scabra TaxID=79078 RepID=A0ABU6QFJ3_9FABA|nr:hypothetical protein [Stylosanthes scabra]
MVRGSRGQAAGRGREQAAGRGRGREGDAGPGHRQSAVRDGDISRLNRTTHIVKAMDFQTPRLLELRRGSITMPSPPAIIPHLEAVDFEGPMMMRDFDIDSPILSSFVERWRPETHSFYLPFAEATITL